MAHFILVSKSTSYSDVFEATDRTEAKQKAAEKHGKWNIAMRLYVLGAEVKPYEFILDENKTPQIPDLSEIPDSNTEWKEATQTPPVRVSLNYKNQILATIMRKLSEELATEFDSSVKVIEDNHTKWAIETAEQYYFTVHEAVKKIAQEAGVVFKAASTQNPDWDVFCSA